VFSDWLGGFSRLQPASVGFGRCSTCLPSSQPNPYEPGQCRSCKLSSPEARSGRSTREHFIALDIALACLGSADVALRTFLDIDVSDEEQREKLAADISDVIPRD
jgi:hypothetical protein